MTSGWRRTEEDDKWMEKDRGGDKWMEKDRGG